MKGYSYAVTFESGKLHRINSGKKITVTKSSEEAVPTKQAPCPAAPVYFPKCVQTNKQNFASSHKIE